MKHIHLNKIVANSVSEVSFHEDSVDQLMSAFLRTPQQAAQLSSYQGFMQHRFFEEHNDVHHIKLLTRLVYQPSHIMKAFLDWAHKTFDFSVRKVIQKNLRKILQVMLKDGNPIPSGILEECISKSILRSKDVLAGSFMQSNPAVIADYMRSSDIQFTSSMLGFLFSQPIQAKEKLLPLLKLVIERQEDGVTCCDHNEFIGEIFPKFYGLVFTFVSQEEKNLYTQMYGDPKDWPLRVEKRTAESAFGDTADPLSHTIRDGVLPKGLRIDVRLRRT